MLEIALWAIAKWAVVVFLIAMPVASLLTWAERRQSAMMQDRLGPNRANIGPLRLWGIPHFLADALKMINKEDFVPGRAHKGLFSLAPIMAMAPPLIVFAVIPFGPKIFGFDSWFSVLDPANLPAGGENMQIFAGEFGMLFVFAIASLSAYGASLAGWASYNNWALLGGLRAASQMISYEVAMGLSILGMFLITGTLEPGAMVDWQGPEIWRWGVVVQPLGFLLFLTAAIAETKRTPFDLPEGESEIVGYFIEYSGLRFGLFFLGEFLEIVFLSAIVTTLFFGGYHIPFLFADGIHLGSFHLAMPHIVVVALQMGAWAAKLVFFCWLQLLIRWTLPRFRPDQLMNLGWKMLLPLSLINIVVTALILLWVWS